LRKYSDDLMKDYKLIEPKRMFHEGIAHNIKLFNCNCLRFCDNNSQIANVNAS
jgi:hypothetical protein